MLLNKNQALKHLKACCDMLQKTRASASENRGVDYWKVSIIQ